MMAFILFILSEISPASLQAVLLIFAIRAIAGMVILTMAYVSYLASSKKMMPTPIIADRPSPETAIDKNLTNILRARTKPFWLK